MVGFGVCHNIGGLQLLTNVSLLLGLDSFGSGSNDCSVGFPNLGISEMAGVTTYLRTSWAIQSPTLAEKSWLPRLNKRT